MNSLVRICRGLMALDWRHGMHVGLPLLLLIGLVVGSLPAWPLQAAPGRPVFSPRPSASNSAISANALVQIRYDEGSVVVDPLTVRIALGDSVTWLPSAALQKDPLLRDLDSIEVFFKSETPFDNDKSFATPPGLDFSSPITSSLATRLGQFDYGIRFLDAQEQVLLEIDPQVWVAGQWYLSDLPLVLKGYPPAPRPQIIEPVEGAVIAPNGLAILSIQEEPPHQIEWLEPGLTAVNMQDGGRPIEGVGFAYRLGGGDWVPIGRVEGDLGGWYTPWEVGGLADGAYALRVVMTDTMGQLGRGETPVWVDETPPIPLIITPTANAAVSGMVQVSVVTSATDVVSLSIVLYDEWAYWWPAAEWFPLEAKWGKAHKHGNVKQEEVGKDSDDGTSNNFCGPTAAGNALEGLSPANNRDAQVQRAKDLAKEMGTDNNAGTPNVGEGKTFESGLKKYIQDHNLDLTVTGYHAGEWDDGTLEFPTWSDLESEFSKGEQIVVLVKDLGADGKPGTDDDGPGHYMGVSNVQHGNANPSQHAKFRDPDTGADTGDITITEDGKSDTPMTLPYDGNTCWIVSFWAISEKDKDNKSNVCADADGGDGWACIWDSEDWTENWYLLEAVTWDADGKRGSAMQMIELRPACAPLEGLDFGWSPDLPVAGEVITFSASVSGSEPIDYDWDFGDGFTGTGALVLHSYDDSGTYTVNLKAANPCSEQAVDQSVLVDVSCRPPSDADFDWWPELPTIGETVLFTATASGSEPISYTWHLGDGSVVEGQVISHSYDTSGTVEVELVAVNLCGSEAVTHVLTIEPGCVPPYGGEFSWTPDAPIAGETITFTGSSGGTPPFEYLWDFGDGYTGTGQIATHAYAAEGDYLVTMVASNDCGAKPTTQIVTVLLDCEPPYDADFSWEPLIPAVGDEVTFTGSASGSEPLEYWWDFGDGNTGTGQIDWHSYDAPGVYSVSMVVSNDCGYDWVEYAVEVCEPPYDADFYWEPLIPVAGEQVVFYGSASGSEPLEYWWDFGDGITGTGQIALHTYGEAGTFGVWLWVINPCGEASAYYEVMVLPFLGHPAGPNALSFQKFHQAF
ncbi:MAG: PKD domain-containing protein [Chloroflexia bacterium]|nr:PKD domain-containing protein [Chloroflexia bacterium]